MTSTTSQAVRDARVLLTDRLELGRHPGHIPGCGLCEEFERHYNEDVDAFESAVRADEAGGLVDILARLVLQSPSKSGWRCDHCGGLDAEVRNVQTDKHEFFYQQHTPDCPWVEGMNAVAEARTR